MMNQRQVGQLVQTAAAAQQAGQREAARRGWDAVLAAAPEHPVALNALGADALQHDDAQAACAFFRRATDADPASPDLWFNLARAQQLAGDQVGRRDSLERCVARAPTALLPNVRLAEFYQETGALSAAAERWTNILAIAQQSAQLSPGIQPLLEQGRRFLADQAQRLGDEVDRSLASTRAAQPPAERRRIDAAVDYTLGRRPIYLNQCSGLHVPFLPADEFFDPAFFPWFADLAAATPGIVAELQANQGEADRTLAGFAPYIDLPAGVASPQWDALDKSTNWSSLHFWRDGVRDDAVCARFPVTAALFDTLPLARLPKRMPTIFFSALKPKTHIPAHTGVTNARAIVHLPLIVPEGCRLRVGGETREWRVGEPFAFDDTIEHEAWNDGGSIRVVLIMDAWNPHLTEAERAMIAAFYAASEQSTLAPTLAERMRLG